MTTGPTAAGRSTTTTQETDDMERTKGVLGLAGALLAIALLLAIAGLMLDALRWLLIIAAVALVVAAAVGWVARRGGTSDAD